MSKIFMVMGKSASGKDTIFKKLKEISSLDLKSVVPYTTRPIRNGEVDGEDYFFVTTKELEELLAANKVIEHRAYTTIHGVWHYFTVDDAQIELDKHNYILIGTLESYEQIRNYYGMEVVIPIYIEVEDGLRLFRALKRERSQASPKYSELCRRFLADCEDFSSSNLLKLNITKFYSNVKMKNCLRDIIKDIKDII